MDISDVKALAKRIRNNQVSDTIDLEGKFLNNEDIRIFSEALKVNTNLIHFNIGRASFGNLGATHLAEALKVNRTLRFLNVKGSIVVSDEWIGNEGTIALAEALKVNNTLVSLNLRRNKIGNKGALALLEMVKVNKTICYINLEGNSRINKDIITAIETNLANNRKNKKDLEAKPKATQKAQEKLAGQLQAIQKELEVMREEFQKQLEQQSESTQQELEAQKRAIQTLKIQLAETRQMAVATKLEQKRRIGQYDEEYGELQQELERLDDELNGRLKELLDEELEHFAENNHKAQEEAKAEVESLLKAYSVDAEHCNDILTKAEAAAERMEEHTAFMKEQRKFMQTHGKNLVQLSGEQQIKNEFQTKLITHTPTRIYYHTLVTSLDHLYLAASVASTGHFNPEMGKNKSKTKFIRDVLKVTAKAVPIFGGVFDVAANVVDRVGRHYTKKALKNFAAIGEREGKDVSKIIQTVAQQLVLTHSGKFSRNLAEQHISILCKAVFNGALNKLTNKKVTTADALLNIVEGKDINTERPKATSNPNTPPKRPENTGPINLKKEAGRIRKLYTDGDDALEEQPPVQEDETKELLLRFKSELELLQSLTPEEKAQFKESLHAQTWRGRVAEEQQKERLNNGDLKREFQKKFVTPGNNSRSTSLVSKQREGFWKPNTGTERNLQNTINARLNDIYDGLFEEITITSTHKRTLKDRIRAAVVDKVLRDRSKGDETFQTAFLDGDINTVFETLKTILQKFLPAATPIDDAFAKKVVNELAGQLQPNHTLKLSSL